MSDFDFAINDFIFAADEMDSWQENNLVRSVVKVGKDYATYATVEYVANKVGDVVSTVRSMPQPDFAKSKAGGY